MFVAINLIHTVITIALGAAAIFAFAVVVGFFIKAGNPTPPHNPTTNNSKEPR